MGTIIDSETGEVLSTDGDGRGMAVYVPDIDALAVRTDAELVALSEHALAYTIAQLDGLELEDAPKMRATTQALQKLMAAQAQSKEAKLEAANNLTEARLRIERYTGAMIPRMQEAGLLEKPGGDRKSMFKHGTLISSFTDYAITRQQAFTWRKVARIPLAIFEDYIATGKENGWELSTAGLFKFAKDAGFDAAVDAQREEIEGGEIAEPEGFYSVLVIDPPWPYGTKYDSDGRRAANPYPEMSLDELQAMELPAADDCVLWLWTTHKFMRHAFGLLDAWGFRDVAILTWVKDRMGLGTWLRSQSEFCIMAVKGRPTIHLTNQTTVIHGPMREHSRKPDEFYAMVDALCVGRKLDYFSREQREGWEQAGNDVAKF